MEFELAPMDATVWVLTLVALSLPVPLLATSLVVLPVIPLGIVTLLVGMDVIIWCWMRPSRFEVDAEALHVIFPWRTITIPRADIVRGRIVTRSEFRAEYGFGARIGAGGLWGGFGLLWTQKRMFMLYVSRVDRMLVVERHEGRWLLLTPDDLEACARALTGLDRRTVKKHVRAAHDAQSV